VVHVDGGKISTQKHWTFEITDISAVPIQYMQVNDVSERKAIRDGVREIAGIRIFQQDRIITSS